MTDSSLNRILYVEDEPDIQEVARMALEMVGGFTVQICSSGQEAVEVAPGFAPDLILLDVMMPGMDGPSTMKALREIETLSQTPVAFMTAKVQPNEIQEYIELGAINVIPKPFDPMTLSAQVVEVWDARNG